MVVSYRMGYFSQARWLLLEIVLFPLNNTALCIKYLVVKKVIIDGCPLLFSNELDTKLLGFLQMAWILKFNDYSMLPLVSVSSVVVFEIVFSCPIVPTDLLEFKVIFCDEIPGWFYSEWIHAIFQDIRGLWGWRYSLILMGIREQPLKTEAYYIPIFLIVI